MSPGPAGPESAGGKTDERNLPLGQDVQTLLAGVILSPVQRTEEQVEIVHAHGPQRLTLKAKTSVVGDTYAERLVCRDVCRSTGCDSPQHGRRDRGSA